MSRRLLHVELQDPTVRRKLTEFLGKRSDTWFRAQDANAPISKLETAWRELWKKLCSDCNLGVASLATLDSALFGADQCNMAAEMRIDLPLFRRMYYDYALGSSCSDTCVGIRSDLGLDPCGDVLQDAMKWRFDDVLGTEGSSHLESTWRQLRGLNLRAFALLFVMHTVLFLADMVGDCAVGQERVSLVLGICQDRLLHIVNTGVDDISRNTKSVCMVTSVKGVKVALGKKAARKR